MPAPPPWWMLTQVAPAAVLTSALSSGQSAIASEPSRIASVSRLGDATEPASRWSRPITIGALTAPVRDQLVEREAGLRPLAVAEPADARRQPLERHPLLRHADPAAQRRVVGEELQHGLVGAPDVRRVARQRGPAERALALAEERPDERGHEAREVEGVRRRPGLLRLGPQVVAVVEGDRAGLWNASIARTWSAIDAIDRRT